MTRRVAPVAPARSSLAGPVVLAGRHRRAAFLRTGAVPGLPLARPVVSFVRRRLAAILRAAAVPPLPLAGPVVPFVRGLRAAIRRPAAVPLLSLAGSVVPASRHRRAAIRRATALPPLALVGSVAPSVRCRRAEIRPAAVVLRSAVAGSVVPTVHRRLSTILRGSAIPVLPLAGPVVLAIRCRRAEIRRATAAPPSALVGSVAPSVPCRLTASLPAPAIPVSPLAGPAIPAVRRRLAAVRPAAAVPPPLAGPVVSSVRHRLAAIPRAAAISLLAFSAPVVPSVGAAPGGQLRLEERAAAAGVRFRHHRGARGGRHPVETMGSGVAVLDYDGDGDPDLFFVQGGEVPGTGEPPLPPGALFRNDGRGRFTEVSAAAGFGAPPPGVAAGFGMGAVAADLDDDGDPDLLLTRAGPDLLYENRGDGTFAPHPSSPLPASAVSGLPGGWSASAAFSDLDGDGDLDLFVTRYLDWSVENNPECARVVRGERLTSYCLPDAFSGVPDLLYENRRGEFVEVSEAAGVARPTGKGLGVLAADLVGDPLPDLYVANDTVPNFLFENRGGLRFREVGLPTGVAYDGDGSALAGMGIAVGDIEPDGDSDLFVTNFAGEANTLYALDGRGRRAGRRVFFDDVSFPSGVGRPSIPLLGFGAVFADLDNDGLSDLCVTNGHVLDNAERLFSDAAYRQPDECFANRGEGRFERVWTARVPSVGRGLAAGDFDGDGRVDLVGSRSGEAAALYANETPAGRSAVLFLVGRESNRDGVGAVVRVASGSSEQVFAVTAGDSYLSTSERAVRVGLGTPDAPPPGAASVRWPSGREQRLGRLTPGAFAVLEGVGILPLSAVSR